MVIIADKNNWSGEMGGFKVDKVENSLTFNGKKFFINHVSKNCYSVHNMNYGTVAYVYKVDTRFLAENVSQEVIRCNKCMYTAIYQLLINII